MEYLAHAILALNDLWIKLTAWKNLITNEANQRIIWSYG
jgi:hypothetical protein